VRKILRCEFSIAPPRADGGLAGSGLIVVNPPFALEGELRVILAALTQLLAPALPPRDAYRLDWLAGE
jgi:23S rRNA (adenine2030-N6)-methyltransferase